MNGDLQTRIKPHTSTNDISFSDAKIKPAEKVMDSTSADKTSFKDLIMNSNDDVFYSREAQKNGNDLAGAKTDAEFAKMLSEKFNKENLRKPQNELDKESFLKLFVTQLQNQDPLNPDDSAQMAAQLAQFHGLEQMMNVNKNLEKMQEGDSTSRSVGLINFVGKDIKLDSGKVRLENGVISPAMFRLDAESADTKLEVRDSAGVVVHSSDLGIKPTGEHLIEWNGLDNEGKKAPTGAYTINVLAKDMNGNDLISKMTTTVRVTGVDLKDSGGSFYTDMGKVRISEISSVGELGALKAKTAENKAVDKTTDKTGAAADATSGTGGAEGAASDKGSGDQKNAPGNQTGSDPGQMDQASNPTQPKTQPVAATAPDAEAIAAANKQAMEAAPSNRNLINSPGLPPMMEIPVPQNLGNGKS